MKTKNKILLLTGMSIAILMCSATTSNAALQANGSTGKKDVVANWIKNVRKMEETGGTLGLADTINMTDLTSSATTSNNLDIHMELNTEYGAMAILSASSYGKQDKINDGETTTGNKSGVYINLNRELVATQSNTGDYNARYINVYDTKYEEKIGDAIRETSGWHGGTATWKDYNYSRVIRAYSGSIFSYYAKGATYSDAAHPDTGAWYTRAVVVIGNGL